MVVELITQDLAVFTRGLVRRDLPELRVAVRSEGLLSEAEVFLNFVLSYLSDQSVQIKSGDTLGYGYWHVKFQHAKDWFLEAWEYTSDASKYVEGAELTLTYWRDQHLICDKFNSEFTPPRPDAFVMVSKGVLEGEAVQGVRYPSPSHMSGWWITTDQYDGNAKSLSREHIYHLTHARPDLAKYIALSFGFCFNLEDGERVYFDQEVANSPY